MSLLVESMVSKTALPFSKRRCLRLPCPGRPPFACAPPFLRSSPSCALPPVVLGAAPPLCCCKRRIAGIRSGTEPSMRSSTTVAASL